MSSQKLRDDTICQNCYYTVDRAYCSNCGQKNTETRQSFFHLITHFAEDFTHYDGAFWKTIVHLLFRPAKLTQEYLSGKRQTYVPPVKLYIFISFVTFFLLAVLNTPEDAEIEIKAVTESKTVDINLGKHHFSSYEELQDFLKTDEAEDLNPAQYWFAKAMLKAQQKGAGSERIIESYIRTLPKVLFIYMPIFAFWLWLFHSKKKWYFFDHGIFTLHYFSFLLLSITIAEVIMAGVLLLSEKVFDAVLVWVLLAITGYWVFYFFRAHSRMYGERKLYSRLKSVILFLINISCITIVMIAALFYVLDTVH